MLQLIQTNNFLQNKTHLDGISEVNIAIGVIPHFISNTAAIVPYIASLFFFYAGFMFVTATSEDRVKKAQSTVLSTFAALVIFGLIVPIQKMLQQIVDQGIQNLAAILTSFINEILNFSFTILNQVATVVAIFMLILTGYQLILSFGDSDKAKDARQSATGIFIALIVIGLARSFTSELFQLSKGQLILNTDSAISFIAMLVNTALSLAAITAVSMMVYAGYKLLFAGEGDSGSAKKTIQHAVIGLIIIMLSMSLTNIVYSFVIS